MEENLKVIVEQDVVWLNFNASNGQSAMINVNALANAVHGPITESALKQWCEDRRRES